jgi:hypothetical protein
MNAKERNDYNNFRRGNDKKKPQVQEKVYRPPMMFPNQNEAFMMQQSFGYGFAPQIPQMGLPMNPMNLGMPLPAAYRK